MAADEPPLPAATSRRWRRAARAAELVRRTNRRPALIRAMRSARELLPGDESFGDQLSTADDRPTAVIARFLAEPAAWLPGIEREPGAEGPVSASRELALAGLQVWQALSERVGRGAGTGEATIMFTDLVGFSAWVLGAGDEQAVELLRAVAGAVEPAVAAQRGRVVKRLGDGHMAVFPSPLCGLEAALAAQQAVAEVEVGGYRPQLRAGLHRGQPRRLGGDYLGADVNIAARVSEAARAGEVLASGPLLAALQPDELARWSLRRRRGFRGKGIPPGLEVYVVSRG